LISFLPNFEKKKFLANAIIDVHLENQGKNASGQVLFAVIKKLFYKS